MKLSYNQFRELYGNRSVTDWTKFNWLGEYPAIQDYTVDFEYNNTSESSAYITIVDAPALSVTKGMKAFCKVYIQSSDYNDIDYIYFPNSGQQSFLVGALITFNANTDDKPVIRITAGKHIKAKIRIVIRKVVENLVADATFASGVIGTKKGNNFDFVLTSITSGVVKDISTSNLELGTYRYHFDVNYSEVPLSQMYAYIYNRTTHAIIKQEPFSSTTNWTFTLTEDNYTVGNNISIEIYPGGNYVGKKVSITNFYVCKMSYIELAS